MQYIKSVFILTVFTVVLSVAPAPAHADLDPVQRELMLKQIELLQAEIIRLQQLLGGGGAFQSYRVDNVYPSRFYSGEYEALYFVDDIELERRNGNAVRYGDQLVWDTFVDLMGNELIENNVDEFRVFNDEENLLTGYVEQRTDGKWILSINRLGDNLILEYDSDYLVELLLHEGTHIIFFNEPRFETAFIDRYWDNSTMRSHQADLDDARNFTELNEIGDEFYERYPSRFVSYYAATSPVEDVVESFVHFVQEARPTDNSVASQKMRFFYNYPEMVALRNEFRETLY